jgi:hypothetical protein
LTKAITILALTCVLVVGAAVTSILTRETIPSAGMAASAADINSAAELKSVVANRDDKEDKLTVAAEPLQTPSLDEPVRQAYASSTDADLDAARAVTPAPVPVIAAASPPSPKPKAASRPQPQHYALLSDAQIAGIKQRLRLTSSQEYYWPSVEQALRAIARKIEIARHVNPNANAGSLDPDSPEVQQLKSAAMPLLFQLRDDQKDEVRKLARIIGLDKVAAAI